MALNLALAFGQEIVVDLFAGLGGASEGIEQSYGPPHIAVNHNAVAVGVHRVNHPATEHFTCDVFEVDPLIATRGRPVGVLWASPDCRHHSKAKGGRPVDKKIRGLAWVVVRWAFACKPRVIYVENVEEFKDWCPLDDAGERIKSRRGETFDAFIRVLSTGLPADHPAMAEIREFLGDSVPLSALVRGLGYNIQHRELVAYRYRAPTTRKRLYIVARCDGRPIVWPEPTHGRPDDPDVIAGRLQPWRTAAECIDWNIPCPSIFNRKRGPLKPNSLRRVVRGVGRFVIDSPNPFIVPMRGTSSAHSSVQDVGAPASTVTAGGTHHALVTPYLTEYANASTQRIFDAAEPMRTQCAQVKGGHFAVVAPSLMHLTHHKDRPGGSPEEPIATVTGAHRGEQALLAPVLIPRYGERPGQEPRCLVVDAPAPTVVPTGNGGDLCAAHLIAFGQNAQGSDPREPAQTVLAGAARYGINAAHVVKFRGDSAGHAADTPLPTVTGGGEMKRPAGAAHALGVVTAHLEQANTGMTGHDVRRPMSTITGKGAGQRLVTAHLVKYYGSGSQWQDARDPMHTIPTKARIAVVETVAIDRDLLTSAQWESARQCAALMREYAPERFPVATDEPVPEIVIIGGYILVDIGLRMLTPRELARAQGFDDGYVIDHGIDDDGHPFVVNKTNQVRLVGNSVCPPVARALIAANCADMIDLYARQSA